MNAFDIFLLILIAVAAIWGFISGFTRQLGTLAGLILGIIACRIWGHDAVSWLVSFTKSEPSISTTAMAYIGLFIVVFIAVWIIASLLRKVLYSLQLGLIDRLAGALLRVVVWVFMLSLALNAWHALMPASTIPGKWAALVEAFAPSVIGIAKANVTN